MNALFYQVLIIFVFLLSPVFASTQVVSRKIQPYVNPVMIKAGNVSSQYATFSNDFIDVDYRPFIFEAGLNYIHSYKHWSWTVGIAQIYERHSMKITFPSLNNDEYGLNNYYRSLSFSSNFLGLKAGFSRQLSTDFRLNFNFHYFLSLTRQARIVQYGLPNLNDLFFDFNYEYETPEGSKSVSTSTNSTLSEQKYKPFLMPEISVDYSITPSFLLSLGFRTQFWSNPDNYRFAINMSGYVHAPIDEPEPESELLHKSRITPKGYYLWLGLKYDIPINTNKD
jgi:hypothetical protein